MTAGLLINFPTTSAATAFMEWLREEGEDKLAEFAQRAGVPELYPLWLDYDFLELIINVTTP